MVRPISNDLRKRAVSAVAKGESCRSVAERFGVAVSSVVKWSQRYRTTGSVAPGKMGGHRKPVLDAHRAFVVERITQMPHLTLHGLKAELAARGVKVSHNAVWLFLRREGLRLRLCSRSNRPAPTFLVGVSAGDPGSSGSDPSRLIDRPGDQHRCGAGSQARSLAFNGECFQPYVEHLLLPILRNGDFVILDNLGTPKSKSVR